MRGHAFGTAAKGCIHLHFATLAQLRPRAEEFNNLLDPVEQDRAERFRFAHDRERFVLGHGFLRSILGSYLRRDGSLIRLARGPFGKPYLERKDLHFNFSDTKDAILVAFATGHDIGADIETMAREVDHAAVSEHYFTAPEVRAILEAGAAPARGASAGRCRGRGRQQGQEQSAASWNSGHARRLC